MDLDVPFLRTCNLDLARGHHNNVAADVVYANALSKWQS